MTDDWTAYQRKFIEWLAIPKSQRKPATHEEFADEIGVTSRTLRNWKQDPALWTEVHKLAETQLSDALAEIYNALAKKASKGNTSAIRLALEAVGKIGQENTQTQTVNIQPFTAQELAAAQQQSETFNSELSELSEVSENGQS